MDRTDLATNDNILSFPTSDNARFNFALNAYEDGRHREALERAIALIDDGYGHANTLAGAIYEGGGNDVPQNLEKALFYYQKAVDEVGAVEGWLALGRMYYFGKGVQQDYEKAFYYYSVLDEDADNRVAHLMLGRMYLDGAGTKKDINRARAYFEKAIKEGALFAITYLALLEKECGHHLRSVYLRMKAAYLAFSVTYKDPADSRLRQW